MKLSSTKIIIYSIIAEIMALMVAVFAAGAGHGSYAPARLLFPFTMLSSVLDERIENAYVLLGLIQFPAYGLILAKAIQSKNSRLIIDFLIVLHVAAAIIVFIFPNQDFPN